jgi:hypothetical protein
MITNFSSKLPFDDGDDGDDYPIIHFIFEIRH